MLGAQMKRPGSLPAFRIEIRSKDRVPYLAEAWRFGGVAGHDLIRVS